jgi:o-succinylbenzoate synthase
MKLTSIELIHVRMPLLNAFETSFGRKNELNHIIVRATEASGLVGYGETACPTRPDYCAETLGTCLHIQRDWLVPAVLGKAFADVAEFVAHYSWVRGNGFARAGLELAVWDIVAQAANTPLAALLGGTRTAITSGVSLGIEPDRGRLFSLIDQYLAEGYQRIKLKIKPGHDLAVVHDVRTRYPTVPLQVDANSAYTLADLPRLKELDAFDLILIEQPLPYDDIVDHAQVQAALRTPICLDESIHSAEDARKAIGLGSCQIINIKPGRVGGLLEARRIHDLCATHGIPVWCGGMHEFGVGRAHNIAISSLPNFSIHGDVSGSDKYYAEDIVTPLIHAEQGAIAVPQTPGLGYAVDARTLARYTVGVERFA